MARCSRPGSTSATASPSQQAGKKYAGAALCFASSKDGGATYSDAQIALDNTCECCRLGAGVRRRRASRWSCSGTSLRAASATTPSSPSPTPRRRARRAASASTTGRSPHARITGRALRSRPTAPITSTWFTNGKARKGLFYAHSRDGGKSFSAPIAIGEPKRQPSRPYRAGRTAWTDDWPGRNSTAKRPRQADDLGR